MNLHMRPLLSALLRSWAGPVLVVLQVAVALAVLVNAVYVVKQRVDKVNRPTGMDVENLFVVRSMGVTGDYVHEATIREDLAYLRSVPGVIAATPMDYPPLSGRGNRVGVMLEPEDQTHAVGASYYEVDEQAPEALGLRLASGRFFRAEEVLPPKTGAGDSAGVRQVVITQALADDLYPDGDALGKPLYDSFSFLAGPATIIGTLEHMMGGHVSWNRVERVVLAPRLPFPDEEAAVYVVRAEPGRRDEVMRVVEEAMRRANPQRLIEWIRPLEFFWNRSYLPDRNMSIFLVAVTALLLAITAIGIFGLAAFNVGARSKQIGIRRALGATRSVVIGHFLLENWLVTTAGIVVGSALALAVGYGLSTQYDLPRLNLYYLVGGIPVLWLIGLLAAWYPARRAAAVSPAVATRTV